MAWIDIFVLVMLGLGALGGLKDGAVKGLLSLVVMIVAAFLAGNYYYLIASLFSLLPGNWPSFIGFFILFGLATALLHLLLFIPRRFLQKLWEEGPAFRVMGGVFSLIGTCFGFVIFSLVLSAFPVSGWLDDAVSGSAIITLLVRLLGFIAVLLPGPFQPTVRLFGLPTPGLIRSV